MTGAPSDDISEPGSVPDSSPSDQSPRARFVAALRVRRNVAAGLAVGVAVAVAVYWVFVGQPARTAYRPVLYVPLSLTVALATGAVVAFALTVVQAVVVWRRLDEGEG